MSHFTVLRTQIRDVDALVKALGDVGFEKVEVHDVPQHLHGYLGDKRPEVAEVIVRRQYVGTGSNDIGFRRRHDGSFEAIVSAYDRRRYSKTWLDTVTQRHAYHSARTKLAAQGFDLVTEETGADGRIHLVLRRTVCRGGSA